MLIGCFLPAPIAGFVTGEVSNEYGVLYVRVGEAGVAAVHVPGRERRRRVEGRGER